MSSSPRFPTFSIWARVAGALWNRLLAIDSPKLVLLRVAFFGLLGGIALFHFASSFHLAVRRLPGFNFPDGRDAWALSVGNAAVLPLLLFFLASLLPLVTPSARRPATLSFLRVFANTCLVLGVLYGLLLAGFIVGIMP